MTAVTAAAPGKVILTGEHAVVYQRPALVAAIDLLLRVTITERSEAGVELRLTDLDHRETVHWDAICEYAGAVRERWRQYIDAPTPEAFARMQGDDPAHLVKVALGETARRMPQVSRLAVTVTVQSEQPIGAGFGSSAAVAAAVARACLAIHDIEVDDEMLYELALDVERRQHGTPSGVDPATVLRGGVVWAERDGDRLRYETVVSSAPMLGDIRVFDTGTPNESTGTVVDAVRDRREADPVAFREALDRIEGATHTLRSVLALKKRRPEATMRALRRVEAGLEALGVVPDPVQGLIRTIEEAGGAAKISGAGALSGSSAGSLLVYHPDPDAALWTELRSLREIDGRLGADGVRIEP